MNRNFWLNLGKGHGVVLAKHGFSSSIFGCWKGHMIKLKILSYLFPFQNNSVEEASCFCLNSIICCCFELTIHMPARASSVFPLQRFVMRLLYDFQVCCILSHDWVAELYSSSLLPSYNF